LLARQSLFHLRICWNSWRFRRAMHRISGRCRKATAGWSFERSDFTSRHSCVTGRLRLPLPRPIATDASRGSPAAAGQA
jgi:hypothetical protein